MVPCVGSGGRCSLECLLCFGRVFLKKSSLKGEKRIAVHVKARNQGQKCLK